MPSEISQIKSEVWREELEKLDRMIDEENKKFLV